MFQLQNNWPAYAQVKIDMAKIYLRRPLPSVVSINTVDHVPLPLHLFQKLLVRFYSLFTFF